MAVHDDEQAQRVLARIVACLGIPVEGFRGEAGPTLLRDAGVLLRLWGTLRTDEGRRWALDALRRIVNEDGG